MDFELELKLIPAKEGGNDLFADLEYYGAFGPYTLSDLRKLTLHDNYYDSRTSTLFNKGIYLRIRRCLESQQNFVTLRGFTAIGIRVLHISDINEPIQEESIKSVLLELSRFTRTASKIVIGKETCGIAEWERVLSEIGLHKILELDDYRTETNLVFGDEVIGSMSFDNVIFDFKGSGRMFKEIEIKVHQEFQPHADGVIAELTKVFGPIFEASLITKLQRGILLKRALQN